MNILFVMLIYDDASAGRGYYSDLVQHVNRTGHKITVIAPSVDGFVGLREEAGVSVIRVNTGKLFEVHKVIKGINNLRLPGAFQKALDHHLKDSTFDWVVSPTPPITFAPLIKKLRKRYGCRSYLVLRDIFPQNARDLGFINNSLIFNFFRRKEKQMYQVSDIIGCMSQGNIDYVANHNPQLDSKKLTILYNWIGYDEDQLEGDESRQQLRERFKIDGKFVALFGGNLGKPQGIDAILDLAQSVKETHPDIHFLLMGNGTERDHIERTIKDKSLHNVELRPFLPRTEYLKLASVCDLGLVNLSKVSTTPNIPLRTFAYWTSELPVLASLDAATDIGKIIERANGGKWSLTGDLDSYRANLLTLYENDADRKQMGRNGKLAVALNYKTEVIGRRFIEQLDEFMKTGAVTTVASQPTGQPTHV